MQGRFEDHFVRVCRRSSLKLGRFFDSIDNIPLDINTTKDNEDFNKAIKLLDI